ncbi:MAG: SusC/RagA family TonB-linked outer membrane protein [Phaeodactylibacter xiamenensis]|uniref:SusC/RagA family TonB-linked outer membrane protein n=1 Tax=Phaeodactylibacter xiamenensis TaxID=1524460 RepID=UPI0005C46002|nr:TonB-dependent receptor [Phaeodactylibacter xiamenensis]MCR9051502.1 TonB-dependent receptor [bacterium]
MKKSYTLWRVLPTMLLFLGITLSGFAQDFKVSGKVADTAGEPLIGASVQLKGTSTGTVTDVEGNYELLVNDKNGILLISYVGYQPSEVSINGQSQIDIILNTSSRLLDEVVVVGYGTQEKEDVTGSISSVKGEDLQNLPVIGASQALQGRAAGVQVVRNGGAPGDGGSIRIRGTGTVNNANPLIVVDGVPLAYGSINDINPNDIESMEILKDASSSAIYGTRAANGVVLITTKKGGFNERTTVTLNTYAGISNISNRIDVLDAPSLTNIKKEAYQNDGLDVPDIWNEPAFQRQRTNWQDELFQTGYTQNYDFTISGGSERTSFAFTGGYFSEEGTIDNSFFDRYYARINSTFKVTDWLTIGENMQLTRQEGNFLNTNSAQTGLVWSAIRFHPGLPVIVNEALPGHEIGQYGSSQVSGEFGDINNPIFTQDIEDDIATNNRFLGNLFAEIQILDGLKLRGNFAADASLFDRTEFFPIIDQQIRARDRNALERSYGESYSLLGEYFLTYDKVFAGVHQVNLVGGYTAQQFVSENFFAQRLDFPNEEFDQRFLNAGNTISGASGTRQDFSLLSGFGRLNYSYDGRYLLTATVRRDGSSRFAPDNRWGTFPAFSAGWRISREKFFENVEGISFLKLTGGWGQLGNQEVANLQYLALVASGRRYAFGPDGSTQVVGASLSRIPNESISWETAEMLNFGLEIGLLENRLFGTFNYFIKDTKDMLLAPPTVGTIGRTDVPDQNVGELRNQGLEMELSYRGGKGDFTYNISGNAAFIRNEVTTLFDGNFLASQFYGRPNQEIARTFEGEPIGTFFGWTTDGLYQNAGEISNDANIANDPRREAGLIQPGDVRFVDLNGDGLIDDEDRTIIGDPTPDVTYGLNAGFGYKGFDLNIFFLGVAGVDIYNADRMQGLDASYPFNLYAEAENRWTGEGSSNSIPRASVNRDNLNFRTSDLFIEDGSFLRLKNLSLGYTLPRSVTSNIGMTNLRFYVTGQNVFTITDYSGLDPELGLIDGNLQSNVDYAQYPQARTWVFGLTAGF